MGIEKSFETSQTPHVFVEQVHGNMQLRAWDESRILVSGRGGDYHYKQEGDEIRLGDFEDCRIFVPVAAHVTLGQIHGNAQLGGVRGQITIQQVHGNLSGEELGTVRLGRVDGDFSARAFAGPLVVGHVGGNLNAREISGNVQVEHCGGNCVVREIEGQITLGRVRGNVSASEANELAVESVSGNLLVKVLNGTIRATKVGGNVSVIETLGDLSVEWAGGDLRVRELMGGLQAKVGGTARLNLSELTIPFVTVQAGGDVRCRVPLAVNAKLDLRAGDEIILRNLPMPDEWNARQVQYTLGDGEGALELQAGGRIKLIGGEGEEVYPDMDMDFEFQFQGDFNERATVLVQQVADQVEAQVEAFTRQMNERLAQLDNGDAIAAKVQLKVQSAMRQAEEKIAEAMRRAERAGERQAERQAARDARQRVRVDVMPPMPPVPPMRPMPGMGVPHMAPPPPPASKPKRNPASAEERMMVLRMVEEGKISVEQAEKLLSAMGE